MTRYEALKRLEWFINGFFIHGLSGEMMSKLSTEQICEIYNVDISYFKPN